MPCRSPPATRRRVARGFVDRVQRMARRAKADQALARAHGRVPRVVARHPKVDQPVDRQVVRRQRVSELPPLARARLRQRRDGVQVGVQHYVAHFSTPGGVALERRSRSLRVQRGLARRLRGLTQLHRRAVRRLRATAWSSHSHSHRATKQTHPLRVRMKGCSARVARRSDTRSRSAEASEWR